VLAVLDELGGLMLGLAWVVKKRAEVAMGVCGRRGRRDLAETGRRVDMSCVTSRWACVA
jgi:hypothetical protein